MHKDVLLCYYCFSWQHNEKTAFVSSQNLFDQHFAVRQLSTRLLTRMSIINYTARDYL